MSWRTHFFLLIHFDYLPCPQSLPFIATGWTVRLHSASDPGTLATELTSQMGFKFTSPVSTRHTKPQPHPWFPHGSTIFMSFYPCHSLQGSASSRRMADWSSCAAPDLPSCTAWDTWPTRSKGRGPLLLCLPNSAFSMTLKPLQGHHRKSVAKLVPFQKLHLGLNEASVEMGPQGYCAVIPSVA